MPTKANIGILIPAAFVGKMPAPQEFNAFFRAADALGIHSLWMHERILHQQAANPHPFSMLAWAAGLTSRVKLGTAVVLSTFRHPLLLAKAAATLHYISEGRFSLGLSLGGRPDEFEALGVPLRQRPRRLEETIALLRQIWSGPTASFQGHHFTFEGPSPSPRPARPGDIPILIGGSVEPALKRAGTLADGWIAGSGFSQEQVRESWQKVQQFAREAGKPPGRLDCGKLMYLAVDGSVARGRKRIGDYTTGYYGPQYDVDARCAFGPPDACARKIQGFLDVGVKTMILGLSWPSVQELERIQREVVPLLH